jgi:hypothetical protein
MAVKTIIRSTKTGTRVTNIYKLSKNQTIRITSGAGKKQRVTRRTTSGGITYLT